MKTLKEIQDRVREDLREQFFDEDYGYSWQSNKGDYHKEVLSFIDSLITQTAKAALDAVRGEERELMSHGQPNMHGKPSSNMSDEEWEDLICKKNDIIYAHNNLISDQKKKEKEFMGKE